MSCGYDLWGNSTKVWKVKLVSYHLSNQVLLLLGGGGIGSMSCYSMGNFLPNMDILVKLTGNLDFSYMNIIWYSKEKDQILDKEFCRPILLNCKGLEIEVKLLF